MGVHFIAENPKFLSTLTRDERKIPELSSKNSELSNQTTKDPPAASYTAYGQRNFGVHAGRRRQRGDNVRATSLAEKGQMDSRRGAT
jgi:hypothetical protein